MSDYGLQILPVTENLDEEKAAVRAVLWRVDHGLMDRVEARRVLEALGLIRPDGPILPLRSPQTAADGDPAQLHQAGPESPPAARTGRKNRPSRDRSRT